MKKLSYSSSGVSINKGNKFVSEIKNIIRKDKNLKTVSYTHLTLPTTR